MFIELSVHNAFIVWKKPNNSTKTQLIFRDELIQEIITVHLSGQLSLNAGSGPARLSQNNDPLRLECRHFIRKKSGGKRGRCVKVTKWEYDMKLCTSYVRVMYECRACNVSLCIESWFQIYHTMKDITMVSIS